LAPRIAAALSTPLTATIAGTFLRTLLALALIALAPLIVLVLLLRALSLRLRYQRPARKADPARSCERDRHRQRQYV
jgi:hypothetical protein